MPDLAFPYDFDGRGVTASTDPGAHIRDLIAQVLLTAPGERVMRPDFGAGLLSLVFEPNSSSLAATIQFLAQSSLQHHLSHLIEVGDVLAQPTDSALVVTVDYVVLASGTAGRTRLVLPGSKP